MSALLQRYLELDDGEGPGKVLAHAKVLIKIGAIYREIAPAHLAEVSHVANYKSRIVLLHADSGAVATKLRQMTRTLQETFLSQGVDCTGVQIKVQSRWEPRASVREPAQKPLGARTCRELAALGDSLPASSLRTALEALLERAAKAE
ncbi:MAG TPA: DciA family protein [Accumulibacter sp.]|nr:DciA family protein [Accumulibacter sp.]